jgi:hypothetical protein
MVGLAANPVPTGFVLLGFDDDGDAVYPAGDQVALPALPKVEGHPALRGQ